MLTNNLGLPKAVLDAVRNDPYTRGKSDISVTQLIQPPHQRLLRLQHEVVEDAADRIWSLVGQVGHGIVERAYPQAFKAEVLKMSAFDCYLNHRLVVEKRFFMPVNGWTVSGQVDVIEDGVLWDYKFTSVYSVMGETKEEWVRQLNLLRLLAAYDGIEDIHTLRICAILRDWSKGKAKSEGYPRQQVAVVEIPVWPLADTGAYLLDRVRAHQDANPPVCTDLERWKKDDVFATMRNGRKSAIRLHESYQQADEMAKGLGDDHYVEVRKGDYTRCQEYCNVSHVCPAMKTESGF